MGKLSKEELRFMIPRTEKQIKLLKISLKYYKKQLKKVM